MSHQPEPTLIELIRYNNWANAQVITTCQALTPEQLDTADPGAYGSIRATLEHIIRAEGAYIGRITGARPKAAFKWDDSPNLDEVAVFAAQVGEALLDTVQRTPPTAIIREEEDGKYIEYHARHLFIQVIDHGIEHRTNITTILSRLGLAAPEIDGWSYLFANPERFELKEGTL